MCKDQFGDYYVETVASHFCGKCSHNITNEYNDSDKLIKEDYNHGMYMTTWLICPNCGEKIKVWDFRWPSF